MLTVVDSQINQNLLRAASAEFPEPDWPYWHRYENGKLATQDEYRIPPACRLVLHEMVKAVPVYDHCFADFSFYGAGLHCMPSGSSLGTHLDSQIHPNRRWLRTHSAVLFLNRSWDEEKDGGLFYMLKDDQPVGNISNPAHQHRFEHVSIQFGRMVVFDCDDNAYHGVTQVTRKDGVCRNTLSVFFWRELMPKEYTVTDFRTKAYFI